MSTFDSQHIVGSAGETAPGVVMLRNLWGIPRRPLTEPTPTGEIHTDIYKTPSSKKAIPSRRRSRD